MARVRNLPKSAVPVYRNRAKQYQRQLEKSLEAGDWDAVGLMAVHLAIASADAVTVARLGKVWSGQDHAGSIELLGQVGVEGVEPVVRQLRGILEAKTRVEYGAEALTPGRASGLAKGAIRIFDWAESVL